MCRKRNYISGCLGLESLRRKVGCPQTGKELIFGIMKKFQKLTVIMAT